MMNIDSTLTPASLKPAIDQLFAVSAAKIDRLESRWKPTDGAPVFTVEGRYTARGWTEWTQGFQYGSAILQFDATGDRHFLELGRKATLEVMAPHISNVGVHDHGFNNISTYGNLLRLQNEGLIPENAWEKEFYSLAVKLSGAVQAARWTELPGDLGYIYSFNGPHSLFADTIRSLRALAVSHQLGHRLMGERDQPICLLGRMLKHAETTARYNVFFGTGRDTWDLRGRVAHESIFNLNDGSFRCPSSQQGYSPFTTWTRGLSWILTGYAEQLEFLQTLPETSFPETYSKQHALARFQEVACATADFWIDQSPLDGIPYWDTGAPNLHKLGDYLNRPSDPFNEWEPVDSSAAAIAAQGLLRLGRWLGVGTKQGGRYYQAGLTVLKSLLEEPYLSLDPQHEGLLLHSVYHQPNGWDHVPKGRRVPCGESCMWGDYHARELALLVLREAEGRPYLQFFK